MNKKLIQELAFITFGVILSASGLKLFLVPGQIAAGGLSGLGTMFYYLFHIPVGISIFIMNIPLFLLGLKNMGKMFIIKTLYATVMFSLLADLINFPGITDDKVLATVYGGALMGLGIGIVIKNGATTGGSDMAAKILNHRFRHISISVFLFSLDAAVVIMSAVVFGPLASLYAIASLFISSKVIDLITDGLRTGKAFFIISDRPEEVSEAIIEKVGRGATMLYGKGMYTKREKNVVLSVVNNSMEAERLKKAVKDVDPDAFVISTGVKEVLGEGFTQDLTKIGAENKIVSTKKEQKQ